jgi:hypothetical protein
MGSKPEKHILALSGGKDSAALAVYMKEEYPKLPLEFVFIDSGYELRETYEYIDRVRAVLNIEIDVIGGANKKNRRDFEWWLKEKNNYLPSPQKRWCTDVLKLRPYAEWLNKRYRNCKIFSYVGLRFDEKNSDRKGYIDTSGLLIPSFPFIEKKIVYEDIVNILEKSGLGFPKYYNWRSRSGCYFCFYQTKIEWIGLHDNDYEKFIKAASMEKKDPVSGKQYTWIEGMTLHDLIKNRDEIMENGNGNTQHGYDRKPRLSQSLRNIYNESDCSGSSILGGKPNDA